MIRSQCKTRSSISSLSTISDSSESTRSVKCIYSHAPIRGSEVERLVSKYAKLRSTPEESVQVLPGPKPGEQLIQVSTPPLKIPRRWSFFEYRRQIRSQVGERRDPLFSKMIEELNNDFESNPASEEIEDRLNRLFTEARTTRDF